MVGKLLSKFDTQVTKHIFDGKYIHFHKSAIENAR